MRCANKKYLRFVKPSYDNFVQPSSKHADVVSYTYACRFNLTLDCARIVELSRHRAAGHSHQTAAGLAVPPLSEYAGSHGRRREQKGRRLTLIDCPLSNGNFSSRGHIAGTDKSAAGKSSFTATFVTDTQGILTILRDETTERGDFIFYADRLSTLIVERALTLITYEKHSVRTPLGVEYDGTATTSDVSHITCV